MLEENRILAEQSFDIDFYNWASLSLYGTACINTIFLYKKDSVTIEK